MKGRDDENGPEPLVRFFFFLFYIYCTNIYLHLNRLCLRPTPSTTITVAPNDDDQHAKKGPNDGFIPSFGPRPIMNHNTLIIPNPQKVLKRLYKMGLPGYVRTCPRSVTKQLCGVMTNRVVELVEHWESKHSRFQSFNSRG
jgi:hypothetical protein